VVVTADLDYPRLVATAKAAGPGIILFRGGVYSDADMLRLLSHVLGRAEQLDLEHSITVVERGRIRALRSHSRRIGRPRPAESRAK